MDLIQGAGNKGNNQSRRLREPNWNALRIHQRRKSKWLLMSACYVCICGLKFIEFDHIKDSKHLFDMGLKDAAYIPSRKSLLAGTMLSLDEALRKIASIDFSISTEITSTLVSFRDTYAGNNMKHLRMSAKQRQI